MFRWSRRIFTFVSFFLFAASAALCIRSYGAVDFLAHQHLARSSAALIDQERIVVSGHGGVCIVSRRATWSLPNPNMTEEQIAALPTGWHHERLAAGGYAGDFFKATKQPTHFGFGRAELEMNAKGVTETSNLVVFPTGVAMAAFAIFPFFGIIRLVKARRRLRRLAALNYNGMQTRKLAA